MNPRRMLPADIATCLPLSDVYDVVVARGIADQMHSFILDLMLSDRLWGSLVEEPLKTPPMCFGSCFFISRSLASDLEAGNHPFLLADLCQSQALQTHILNYEEVKKESKGKNLNFYGALFSFARVNPVTHPIKFISAMDHLQHGLVETMAGFGLRRYFKQTYEGGRLARLFKNLAMRKKFGAELVTDYANCAFSVVGAHSPNLFASTRDEAMSKLGMPICELMCPGEYELALPPSLRMVLRLELDGYSGTRLETAMGSQYAVDNAWKTGLDKLNGSLDTISRQGQTGDTWNRERLRTFVKANPQELGVVPHLAEGEKVDWQATTATPRVLRPAAKVAST